MGRPDVDGLNTGYAALLLEQYLDNPGAVPEEWRDLFESEPEALLRRQPGLARLLERAAADGDGHTAPVAAPPPPAAAPAPAPVPAAPADEELLGGIAAAMALVKAFRMHGHLAARIDPLGSEPHGDPALEPERLIPKLTPELQARIPAALLRLHVEGETLADALPRLRETYTGTIAYEIEHISDHEERVWLRQAIESGRYRRQFSRDERVRLLRRLSQVEGMERYLRRAFLGQKQFSVEGLDVMIPMLDEAIDLAAGGGAHEVVVGMAHRGRLNVLAHVVGRPYETILREFEGERTLEAVVAHPEGGTGDVKYHLGAEGTRHTAGGDVTVTLAANPSHLEAVDPVVEGRTRAEQTDRSTRDGWHDPKVAVPVLIHGDAAFPAQGIVAETLNLADLEGYSTGGTLHLISNNQIGFTTDPVDGRSTRYSSDLAKGFDFPIIHVNADDPEACVSAVRLGMAYRRRFQNDVVIDLVGYRRHGHNEQDEAAYTQPLMAARIAQQPTVREQYAAKLVAEGAISEADAETLARDVATKLKEAHERLKESFAHATVASEGRIPFGTGAEVVTAVAAERLRELDRSLVTAPEGFTIHPKLEKQLDRRAEALEQGGIDWGQAESLAFASQLVEGIPIRLNGPEHSSARLERFLQLAAQENIRVANPTTAAQHFHLVRRQALDPAARPLVVMTPKGLLRLKQASSTLAELSEGAFKPVLDDPSADREQVRRLVLCSGKIYYDLAGHALRESAGHVAIARIEQLYPFPVEEKGAVVAAYPKLAEVVWAQEEPQNMGPWRAIRHRLEEKLPDGVRLRYVGRPWRASPSEGYPTAQ